MHIPMVTIVIIMVALLFEFINGFHDTANAVATSISTKSLEPFQAIAVSAIFNLIGAVSGTAVALTIAEGLANPMFVSYGVLFAALTAAIVWNLLTWSIGLPSSSSHALIGGMVGAVIANAGFKVVHYKVVLYKVILPMVASPIIGFILALVIMVFIHAALKNNSTPRATNNFIREIQVLSTAFLSFSHGSNDAQKTMGIITLTLFNSHLLTSLSVPLWVALVCGLCMALGTLSGGIRIIKTLSTRVAQLKPANGFAAEVSSAVLLFLGSRFGMPMSTTHAVSGAIMGAGYAKINWGVVRRMVGSWLLTLPMTIILSSLIYGLAHRYLAV